MLTEKIKAIIFQGYNSILESSHVYLPVGDTYFHWTNDAMPGIGDGKLSIQEIHEKYKAGGTMGGGYYASKNPFEWQDYGMKIIAIEASVGCRVFDLCALFSKFKTGVPEAESITVEDVFEWLGSNVSDYHELNVKQKAVIKLKRDGFSMILNPIFLQYEYNFIDESKISIRHLRHDEISYWGTLTPSTYATSAQWAARSEYCVSSDMYLDKRELAIRDAQVKMLGQLRSSDAVFLLNLMRTFEANVDYHHLLQVFVVADKDEYRRSYQKLSGEFSDAKGLNLVPSPWQRYGKRHKDPLGQWWDVIKTNKDVFQRTILTATGLTQAGLIFDMLININKIFSIGEIRVKDIKAGGAVDGEGRAMPSYELLLGAPFPSVEMLPGKIYLDYRDSALHYWILNANKHVIHGFMAIDTMGRAFDAQFLYGADDASNNLRNTILEQLIARTVIDSKFSIDGAYYFRGTQRDVDALLANPFLILRHVQEISNIAGNDETPGEARFLLNYAYPHIRNYHELMRNGSFSSYMDDYRSTFEGELHRLAWNNEQEVNRLNQQFLRYLSVRVLQDASLSHFKKYQYLISIHPFVDGNGRTMRAFYEIITGLPMFMRNWNLDILCSEDQIKYERIILNKIKDAFIHELHNAIVENRIAAFYDVAILWYAISDELLTKYERDVRDSAGDSRHLLPVVRAIKASIQAHEGLIHAQLPYDVEYQVSKALSSCAATIYGGAQASVHVQVAPLPTGTLAHAP